MNTISLKLNTWVYDELIDYLKSINGIENVEISNDITIYYDNISLKVIIKEIYLFLNILNIPSILSFDKHLNNNLKEYKIVIKNLCCEHCLMSDIEYLLYINGINSAYSDYDFDDKDEVEIYITYDSSIISKEELDKLNKEFNS